MGALMKILLTSLGLFCMGLLALSFAPDSTEQSVDTISTATVGSGGAQPLNKADFNKTPRKIILEVPENADKAFYSK